MLQGSAGRNTYCCNKSKNLCMKWMGVGMIAAFLLLGLNFSRCGGDAHTIDTVACPIAAAVNRSQVADSYYNEKVQLKTGLFYGANEYKRTWLKKRRPDKMYRAFIDEVRE